MKVNVGTGPDSWGVIFPDNPKQIPWNRFLDEVVEAGYEWTELGPYGYLPNKDAEFLRRELECRGLKGEAGFTFGDISDESAWKELEAETLGAGSLAAALGAQHHLLIEIPYTDLVTGELLRPRRLDDEGWKRFIDICQRLARLVRERCGLTAVFHPHADTHVEYEEQIERFLKDTDSSIVALCLDTGHHAYRGGDPVAFMRKHHQRIPYLHIKSVDLRLREKIEQEKTPYIKAVEMGFFCEPVVGTVDFPAFVGVLQEIDYQGFAIVEQDMFPAPFDKPLAIAKRTREYLRRIGMG